MHACTNAGMFCGCAGVVPRPGDPDYMPSHLAAIWHKAGNIWVDNQLRKMQQLHSTTSEDLVGLLPVPPAVDSPVDWPWRPRDLEALLARFDLLIDSEADAQVFGRERFARKHRERDGPSVLTYDGFIGFWDESGIEDLLGEVRTIIASCSVMHMLGQDRITYCLLTYETGHWHARLHSG